MCFTPCSEGWKTAKAQGHYIFIPTAINRGCTPPKLMGREDIARESALKQQRETAILIEQKLVYATHVPGFYVSCVFQLLTSVSSFPFNLIFEVQVLRSCPVNILSRFQDNENFFLFRRLACFRLQWRFPGKPYKAHWRHPRPTNELLVGDRNERIAH